MDQAGYGYMHTVDESVPMHTGCAPSSTLALERNGVQEFHQAHSLVVTTDLQQVDLDHSHCHCHCHCASDECIQELQEELRIITQSASEVVHLIALDQGSAARSVRI
jgi:hypothetical protein